MKRLASIAVAALPLGCASEVPCVECSEQVNRGQIEDTELAEISGLAASFRLSDVFYVHNDSGDSSRIFALDGAGQRLATYELDGAANDDWEDIARAPCAAGECLYIADIGDNELLRTSYTIYLVEEPLSIEAGNHILPSNETSFTYPEGPVDSEVLLVHPTTGAVTIVAKAEDGPAAIYELDTLEPDGTQVARRVGDVDPPKGSAKFTGGTIHPGGAGVLLRTKTRLFHYPMSSEQTAAEALQGEPCQLDLAAEVQGEAVTWLNGGEGIMTIGEGAQAAVNVAECQSE